MKYAVFPDHVVSRTDGQVHFIGAAELINLYGVDPRECFVIDFNAGPRAYAQQMRLVEEEGLIHLRPSYRGNYKLEKTNGR